MIFFVVALANFSLEMILWSTYFSKHSNSQLWTWAYILYDHPKRPSISGTGTRRAERMNSAGWSGFAKKRLLQRLAQWNEMSARDRFGLLVLTPMDIINSVWLTYIVLAQTFGSYRNCSCKSSSWGWHEGYIDFATWVHSLFLRVPSLRP